MSFGLPSEVELMVGTDVFGADFGVCCSTSVLREACQLCLCLQVSAAVGAKPILSMERSADVSLIL